MTASGFFSLKKKKTCSLRNVGYTGDVATWSHLMLWRTTLHVPALKCKRLANIARSPSNTSRGVKASRPPPWHKGTCCFFPAALKIAIGGCPGYQHLCRLILHRGRCQSHRGNIDCNLKREIYGFYTLNGRLPGAQHWR